MKEKLAIIIPAYKQNYLKAALNSIAAQTNKDFTLYIGDDNSPYDLYSIIKPYESDIKIVYKHFDTNLGGKNLVAQWERCVDMSQGEEWIWLFSDDDMMEPTCVEDFFHSVKLHPEAKLFHFNVNSIDRNGNTIRQYDGYPSFLSAQNYTNGKCLGKYISFVVEFIIHREIFYSAQRFVNIDMAWGSDFLSWVKFADAANGIYTIDSSRVLWRSSGDNISTDTSNTSLKRKMVATYDTILKLLQFAEKKKWGHYFFYSKFALGQTLRQRKLLSLPEIILLLHKMFSTLRPFLIRIIMDSVAYPFYKNSIRC